MNFPYVTSIYGALFGLLLVALSVWVGTGRGKYKVLLGDGNTPELRARIRAHANFTEYVPLILLLVALLEGRRTSIFIIHALLLSLLVARIIHPFGLISPEGGTRHNTLRGIGAAVTMLVLIVTCVILLLTGLLDFRA